MPQGVHHEFSHLDVGDVMKPFVPNDRLVPWEYDESQDNDARVLAFAKFLEDDSFVTSREFREYIAELKAQEINERIQKAQEGVDLSQQEEVRKKAEEEIIQEIEQMNPMEARRLVKDNGVLVMPGWNLSSKISLDAIMDDPNAIVSQENFDEKFFGLGFSPSLHALAIWSLTPDSGRCRLNRNINFLLGYLIIGRALEMKTPQAEGLTMHMAMLSVDTVEISQARYM